MLMLFLLDLLVSSSHRKANRPDLCSYLGRKWSNAPKPRKSLRWELSSFRFWKKKHQSGNFLAPILAIQKTKNRHLPKPFFVDCHSFVSRFPSSCLPCFPSFGLSVCRSACMSVSRSVRLSLCLNVCLSVCLSFPSVCMSVCLSICLFLLVCPSLCLSVFLTIRRTWSRLPWDLPEHSYEIWHHPSLWLVFEVSSSVRP